MSYALIPAAARAIVPVVENAIAKNPGVVSRIATAIGTVASPSAILKAIKDSPVLAGLTLYQLGDVGFDAYQTLVESHPEVTETLKGLVFKADEITPNMIGDLGKYADELEVIDDAARIIGGFQNLVKLRQALGLDQSFYGLHLQLASMGYRR